MTCTSEFISRTLSEIDNYIKHAGIAESTLGKLAVRDGTVIARLRRGRVTLRTVQKIQNYIAANNSPEGTK